MRVPGQDRIDAEIASRLGHPLKRVEQILMSRKAAALHPHGITVPQYTALMALHLAPGQSAAQLARTTLVTPQTMATILTNLSEKGLVTREPSLHHAKVLVTDLTPDGERLAVEADKSVKKIEERLNAEYDAGELQAFRAFLERAEAVLLNDLT